ncbi:winged helix-turn-helix domain-containing protein [Paenibacillus larvae]|uniref:helix-turn-helix domain-containing protein n=2 Tax=Paenibacillus larvae TaxID=1464 RepID=UPI0003DD2DCD|nr:winged helix-turn-helix domain-containing protein [Paenibacillus larvae]ETK25789.1 transposase A of IS642 [Paenibacillus larvae subsp. larvae DSM 25719]AVF20608.1 transposase [Paenibacillus larvae subsp. larvae]AVF21269.1 transposase [Paenibacillus larvae subsp. larvae]AVF21718.1 transposase [Paenibacillus larvae subsp. larvae]AVF21789.1 transposase [Paenibacillus larvae subsp. larvae]
MSNKKQIKNRQVGMTMDKHTELAKVTAAMQQTKERRMYERYQAIYLHLKGTSMKAIADILNRNRMTVSSYIHTYENGGLGALQIKHSSGAPTRLTKQQQDRLKQTVAYSVPHEVGFTAKHNWTLELIATYVEREWGHCYSLRGISKVMERLGLSYTKPTYTLAAADPKKQRHFTETTFPELKKSY